MERNSEKDAPFKAADILSEQMVYTYIDKDHYAANTVISRAMNRASRHHDWSYRIPRCAPPRTLRAPAWSLTLGPHAAAAAAVAAAGVTAGAAAQPRPDWSELYSRFFAALIGGAWRWWLLIGWQPRSDWFTPFWLVEPEDGDFSLAGGTAIVLFICWLVKNASWKWQSLSKSSLAVFKP